MGACISYTNAKNVTFVDPENVNILTHIKEEVSKEPNFFNGAIFRDEKIVEWKLTDHPLKVNGSNLIGRREKYSEEKATLYSNVAVELTEDLSNSSSPKWLRKMSRSMDGEEDKNAYFQIVTGITNVTPVTVDRVDTKIDEELRNLNNWNELNVRLSSNFIVGLSISGKLKNWTTAIKNERLNVGHARDAVLYDKIECNIDKELLYDKAIERNKSNEDLADDIRETLRQVLNGDFLVTHNNWFFVMNTIGSTPDKYGNSNLRLFEWIIDKKTQEVICARLRYEFKKIPIWAPPSDNEMATKIGYVSYRIRRTVDYDEQGVCGVEHVIGGMFSHRKRSTTDKQELINTRRIQLMDIKRNALTIESDYEEHTGERGWQDFLFSSHEQSCDKFMVPNKNEYITMPLPMAIALTVGRTDALTHLRWMSHTKEYVKMGKSVDETSECRICHVQVFDEYIEKESNSNTLVRLAYMRNYGRNKNVELWS